MIPITRGQERRRADGAADRRQPRRRIRGPARAVRPGPHARRPRTSRAGHHRAGDELSGLPGRHAHLADRQGQPQPQLSRPAGRHGDARRSPTISSATCCRWPTSCSTSIPAAGRSTSCPSARRTSCPTRRRRRRASRRSRPSRAPYSMRMLEIDAVGMYDTAAEEMGKVFVTTELGGGGTATRGDRRASPSAACATCCAMPASSPATSRRSRRAGSTCRPATASPSPRTTGLIEPMVDLGEPVEKGEVIARIHPIGRTGAAAAGDPRQARRACSPRGIFPAWSRPATAPRWWRCWSTDRG